MNDAAVVERLTADVMIDKYVQLRDRKKEIEERHKQELQPYDQILDQLEGWLLETLNQMGASSIKSAHGTAYKSLRTSAKVIDWPATLSFIRETNAWDLLEARVSKLAAQAILEETNKPIPGVETSSEVCVNVRRASGKDK